MRLSTCYRSVTVTSPSNRLQEPTLLEFEAQAGHGKAFPNPDTEALFRQ